MGHSVLHVAQPTIDGVAVCVERLAVAQRARGWDATVACPDDGPLAGRLAAAGVPVLSWPAGREPGPAIAAETRRLSACIRSADPDLVHLHSSKAGLAGRLAVRGHRPTVFHPHAWSFGAVDGPTAAAARAWERFASRWTARVLCCSEGERLDGVRAGVHAPMVVVGNGVDTAAFPLAGPGDRDRARARLGRGPEPLAVCVGRLSHQKGQDLLLAAWPDVRGAVAAASLVLVGDGPARAALEASALDGVTFVGRRADVADWLVAADVIVVPSRYEGQSLIALEAMATGRSIVAHAVEGMAELLDGTGAGALVAVGNRAALAEAVALRLGRPADADTEGRAGRSVIEAGYGVDAWIERVEVACEAALV